VTTLRMTAVPSKWEKEVGESVAAITITGNN